MPVSGFFVSAKNEHPATQVGSTQCMHCCFTYDQRPPSAGLYSLMMFLVNEFKSGGAWCKPSLRLVSGGRLFASAQAATHDLQPTHRVESYNIETAFFGASLTSEACASPGIATVVKPTAATEAVPVASDLRALRRVM